MIVLMQIPANRRFSANKGSPLGRAPVGPRNDMANDAGLPTVARLDKKIVLRNAVSAHFAERNAEALRANTSGFRQYLQKVVLAKGKAAKIGNCRLLSKKLGDPYGIVIHGATPRAAWLPRAAP